MRVNRLINHLMSLQSDNGDIDVVFSVDDEFVEMIHEDIDPSTMDPDEDERYIVFKVPSKEVIAKLREEQGGTELS